MLILATHAGLRPTAHHVDHRLRPESGDEAAHAAAIAATIGCAFVIHQVDVGAGPNLEARARAARRAILPPAAMTGHTLDDRAETLLIRLLRGSGTTGLAAIRPGPRHPLLALRRVETERVCAAAHIDPVRDPSNEVRRLWRARVRHELIPLADDISTRDSAPILARTADLLADDDALLDELAADIDPTDCRALRTAPRPLARRALRRWLTVDGYPPDAAGLERVLAVVEGAAVACELAGGRRVERSGGRLRLTDVAH